jgi:hypothetical protein
MIKLLSVRSNKKIPLSKSGTIFAVHRCELRRRNMRGYIWHLSLVVLAPCVLCKVVGVGLYIASPPLKRRGVGEVLKITRKIEVVGFIQTSM